MRREGGGLSSEVSFSSALKTNDWRNDSKDVSVLAEKGEK